MNAPLAHPSRKARLAIFISGRGSNMEALVTASRTDPAYPAKPVLVVSDTPNPPGLAKAMDLGIPAARLVKEDYLKRFNGDRAKARYAFEADLDRHLSMHRTDVVALAGFTTILSGQFVRRWPALNIHPSLLPAYGKLKGMAVHEAVLASGARHTGCTVHRVTEGLDCGPPLAQTHVPVMDGDTAETLAARVLAAEHILYPKALAEFVLATPALTR